MSTPASGPGASIKRACIIGAGVMGSGIAAQIANAGIPVLLLDMVPKDGANRDAIAEAAIERLLKADPAPLMSKAAARLIEPGNIEDHLNRLSEVDWVVEAIIEKLDLKQGLYARIEEHRRPGSIVSSNTSTIPLAKLVAGLPERFQADFCITHFFNPPRYMRLLEIVGGAKTRAKALEIIGDFGDRFLGKAIVRAKDTPGFVANRIGVYWMQSAVTSAIDMGLTVEEADAIMGRPIGAPKTGIFGLLDLVGLDLMPHVDKSMAALLPTADGYQKLRRDWPLLDKLIAEGYTGRKGKGGFYRLNKDGGARVKESIDLKTGLYSPSRPARLESVDAARRNLKALVGHPDKGGLYAWAVLSRLLAYAAGLVPEITADVVQLDQAVRAGFNFKRGPFEMIDQMGVQWFAKHVAKAGLIVPQLLDTAIKAGGFYKVIDGRPHYMTAEGDYAPIKRAPGVLLLSDIKLKGPALAKNGSASLWDIGDGVVCLEFHSKMNALDPESLAMVKQSVDLVAKKKMKALVIHNEADNFSVGANIGLAMFAANVALWPMIDDLIGQGQAAYKALKFAPFPVVGAPSGMALGGGCEILLHCAAIQAHAETYMGLVEVGVGLIPGWGGCKEMLIRCQPGPKDPKGPMPPVALAFEAISLARVAKSAAEARELRFLRASDAITMNRDRLLGDAKARALKLLTEGYKPPLPVEFRLPGHGGMAALTLAIDGFVAQGKALKHDRVVSLALAEVLTGGEADLTEMVGEDQIGKLEKKAFMALVRNENTLKRMEHMLETGKPLRN